jgi:hypothetical protein
MRAEEYDLSVITGVLAAVLFGPWVLLLLYKILPFLLPATSRGSAFFLSAVFPFSGVPFLFFLLRQLSVFSIQWL